MEHEYPARALAASLMKIIRYIISDTNKELLEPSLARHFQSELSVSMRRLSRPLAGLAADSDGALRGKSILNSVDEEQKKKLTALLNCGHDSVAAVLSLWQVRHNIVGEVDSQGRVVKEFLRDVSIDSPAQKLWKASQKSFKMKA